MGKEKVNIFIGWSGEYSEKLGNILYDFIQDIFSGRINVFISTKSIKNETSKGNFTQIIDTLKESNFGIFVFTPYDERKGFVYFEYGILYSKEIPLYPIIYFSSKDGLPTPFREQQVHMGARESDMLKIVVEINKILREKRIPEDLLKAKFKMFYEYYSLEVKKTKENLKNENVKN